MKRLLYKLKELSERYAHFSNVLGLKDDEEEFYPDNDAAIDDGRSMAYWEVHLDLEKIIKEFSEE